MVVHESDRRYHTNNWANGGRRTDRLTYFHAKVDPVVDIVGPDGGR